MGGRPRVCVVSASRQNVFFSEMLEAFAEMLEAAGIAVEESVDHFPPLADDLVYMFVPHEYHALVEELAQPTPAQLQRTVAIGTEQPRTHWFDLSASISKRAGAVLDINALGVTELRARGIKAEHLPVGYVPSWDAWGGKEKGKRPLDAVFLGGYAERRGHVLARCAAHLEGRRTALKLIENDLPQSGESEAFWSRGRKWKTLAETKLLLNVHRSDVPYMEWHRILGAQLNGCVVVSEHCVEIEPLVPGEHYISADYWQLPQVVGGLLEDPERIEKIRQQAYAFVREEMPVKRTQAKLLAAVERVARKPLARVASAAPPEPVPLPAPAEKLKPPWEEYAEHAGDSLATRMGLKHLIVRVHNLEHHLETLLRRDGVEEEEIVRFGPALERPRVSVLLTVHNYADFVGEAIRSVGLAKLRDVEVIAIDDASSDDSIAAVESACREHPWLTLTHVRLTRNRGLPAARNLAAEHAGGDLLFILDADNKVMPQGLSLLAQALEDDPEAGFSYGIVQSFDANGPVDLMNWLSWDAGRLRQGNYVDAMAMLRRSAFEAVGGYSTEPALYGWEDYALWLAMADRGYHGAHVCDFVGQYRRSPQSMIALANVDSSAAWGALLRRYPSLASDPAEGSPLAADHRLPSSMR